MVIPLLFHLNLRLNQRNENFHRRRKVLSICSRHDEIFIKALELFSSSISVSYFLFVSRIYSINKKFHNMKCFILILLLLLNVLGFKWINVNPFWNCSVENGIGCDIRTRKFQIFVLSILQYINTINVFNLGIKEQSLPWPVLLNLIKICCYH